MNTIFLLLLFVPMIYGSSLKKVNKCELIKSSITVDERKLLLDSHNNFRNMVAAGKFKR
jgi:hypothetical protein